MNNLDHVIKQQSNCPLFLFVQERIFFFPPPLPGYDSLECHDISSFKIEMKKKNKIK